MVDVPKVQNIVDWGKKRLWSLEYANSLSHTSKSLSLGKMKYIEILHHMVLDFKKNEWLCFNALQAFHRLKRYLNMTTKHKEWWWLQNFVDSGEPSFQGVHTALFQVASSEPLVPKSWDSLSRSPNPSAAHTGEHVHVKCRQDELCQVL